MLRVQQADAMRRCALQAAEQLDRAAERCLHSMHIAILEVIRSGTGCQ